MSQGKKLLCCMAMLAVSLLEAAKALGQIAEAAALDGDAKALHLLERGIGILKKAEADLRATIDETA